MNGPEEIDAIIEEAFDYFYQERYRDSVNRFDTAINRDPMNTQAWKGYHLALDALGAKEAAEFAILRTIELAPEDEEVWYYLTSFFEKLDNWGSEAFTAYTKAVERAPENDDLWRTLAIRYKRRGDLEKAEQVMRRALEISPTNVYHFTVLEAILRSQGRIQEADSYKEKVDDFETFLKRSEQELDAELRETFGDSMIDSLDDDDYDYTEADATELDEITRLYEEGFDEDVEETQPSRTGVNEIKKPGISQLFETDDDDDDEDDLAGLEPLFG